MSKTISKSSLLAMAFALTLFIAAPKRLVAHPASAAMAAVQEPQDKNETSDLNEDREDGPNLDDREGIDDDRDLDRDMDLQEGLDQDLQGDVAEADGAHHDGTFNDREIDEERVQDQNEDKSEDVRPVPPMGI